MRRDYEVVRGSDLVIPTRVARDRAGAIIDLTGASIDWRVGTADRLSTKVRLDDSDGITVVSATDGTYSMVLSASDTSNLNPGHYRYTVKVTESDGSITVVEHGYIEIERSLP